MVSNFSISNGNVINADRVYPLDSLTPLNPTCTLMFQNIKTLHEFDKAIQQIEAAKEVFASFKNA